MRNRRNLIILFAAASLGLALLSCRPASAQTLPEGWATSHPAGGLTLYTPPDLKPGEVFTVAVYPTGSLAGKPLADWLREAVEGDPVKPGVPSGAPSMGRTEERSAGCSRNFTAGGRALVAIYVAASLDGESARVVRIVSSNGLAGAHKAGASEIMRASVAVLKRLSEQGVASGGDAARLTPGGKIIEGVYVGDSFCKDGDGKDIYRNHYRLSLYADGEYCVTDENGNVYERNYSKAVGRYKYDPATGHIDIRGSLNLENREDGEFCLYGRDAAGKPLVSSGWPALDRSATLRYAGPATRPSPEAADRAKAAAKAEAARYKWVTAPGRGLKPAQVAGVFHFYDASVTYGVGGWTTDITDKNYLLLADGTAHEGLPVTPDTLDMAASRAHEPAAWGRWRREGAKILASWHGEPFRPLRGSMALPGTSGLRLNGRWGTGSSSADMTGGSYSLWGVTFTPDGRFVKDGRGGYGNSQFMQTGGQAAVNTYHDDQGSTTSILGGVSAVEIRPHRPGADRSGAYSIDGYALTLRYDNGRVVRLPFFFGSATHKTLWFEGAQLARDDKK